MFNAYNTLVVPAVSWLAAGAIVFVGYLVRLEIRDRIRNRRMDAERERLGLL
jgi:hypothetical protein